jgi:hypothetical protein
MARPEQPSNRELNPRLVEAYTSTFISRRDAYPQQLPDGTYITVQQPLTLSLVEAHLRGQVTLGAYALDYNSMARWVCLDADDDVQWQGLLALSQALAHQQVTTYIEPSRRGGHLWFFTPLLPGSYARRFAHQLLLEQQLENVEIYPKQDTLRSGVGSLVRLPLGIHRKTGRVYHFVTLDGRPLAPTIRAQLAILASPDRVSLPFFLSVLSRVQSAPASEVAPTTTFRPIDNPTQVPLSERLKGTVSVVDFVSRYIPLDRKNTGFCPFHDDQHRSFAVNVEGNYWHCFACCGGGSIIDFWMQWRAKQGQDSSFTATIKELRSMLL